MDFSNMFALGVEAESQAAQIIPIVICIIVTLIQCFFGFKLFRYIMGFWGFALFGYVGYVAAHGFGNQTASIAACVIMGAIGAFIAYKYYKAGVFLQGLMAGFLIGIIIAYFMHWTVAMSSAFGLVIGILLGLLTSYLLKPLIVLTSGISGGMASGAAIAGLFNIRPNFGVFLGIVITILGVGFQFYSIGKDKAAELSKKEKHKEDKKDKKDKKGKDTAETVASSEVPDTDKDIASEAPAPAEVYETVKEAEEIPETAADTAEDTETPSTED